MIKLDKAPTPAVLAANAAAWTDALVRALAAPPVPPSIRFRYRHPEIKAAIVAETSEKCAYCESKIRHVIPGDTEHIEPVSRRPDLAFSWSNLTLVCVSCNTAKLDYGSDVAAEKLVNPYVDEPQEHLRFYGPTVFHITPDRGFLTWKKVDLNRAELVERRVERLKSVLQLIDRWRVTAPGAVRDQLRVDILEEAGRDREFTAAVNDFLAAIPDWP